MATDPEQPSLDDPDRKAKVVRMLLILTPVCFVLCWVLAWVQGAPQGTILLIAAVGGGMTLAAAGAIHVLGSKAWIALVMVKVALALAAKR